MTARKGNTAGQRMMMALVEIGDDEEPVDQAPKDEHKGGALARLAGMWCQDASFVV